MNARPTGRGTWKGWGACRRGESGAVSRAREPPRRRARGHLGVGQPVAGPGHEAVRPDQQRAEVLQLPLARSQQDAGARSVRLFEVRASAANQRVSWAEVVAK